MKPAKSDSVCLQFQHLGGTEIGLPQLQSQPGIIRLVPGPTSAAQRGKEKARENKVLKSPMKRKVFQKHSMCCTKSQTLEMKDHKANKKITALWVQMWQWIFSRNCTSGPSSLTNHTLFENMLWMIMYEPPQHYLSNPDRGIITVLHWQPEVLLLHSFRTQPKHIPPKFEAFPVH